MLVAHQEKTTLDAVKCLIDLGCNSYKLSNQMSDEFSAVRSRLVPHFFVAPYSMKDWRVKNGLKYCQGGGEQWWGCRKVEEGWWNQWKMLIRLFEGKSCCDRVSKHTSQGLSESPT